MLIYKAEIYQLYKVILKQIEMKKNLIHSLILRVK